MKDAAASSSAAAASTTTTSAVSDEKKKLLDLVQELRSHISLLDKAVTTKDNRLIHRVLRSINMLKHKSNAAEVLHMTIEYNVPTTVNQRTLLLDYIDSVKMVDDISMKKKELHASKDNITPEVQAFLHLLVLLFVMEHGSDDQALACVNSLYAFIQKQNRRTLDLIAAKVTYYYALLNERAGKLHELRPTLLAAHRTACLRHDEPGQAVLTNIILRQYLAANLYNAADKFRLNSTFPENRSNAQFARYLFYTGQIHAIQLDYSAALDNLNQALRKAPTAALGFRQVVTKWYLVVQLLMGEIPERSLFATADLKRSLKPYFHLTQAVRVGDLASFSSVLAQFADIFKRDKTLSLVSRLRHNVIKIGLRRINVSYSRISLSDVAQKLSLEKDEDVESIIAKAIHDGVIDAVIDHANACLLSKDNMDLYSSTEPQAALHKRINFCLELNNAAVKALRYPMHMKRDDLETEEERAEREAAEAELMSHLDEAGDEDGDM